MESMRLAALPIVDVPALQAPAQRMIAGPVTVDADMGEDDDELDVLLDELDDLGVQFYGAEEWPAKCAGLAKYASDGKTNDIAQIGAENVAKLVDGLKKRIITKQNGNGENAPETTGEAA